MNKEIIWLIAIVLISLVHILHVRERNEITEKIFQLVKRDKLSDVLASHVLGVTIEEFEKKYNKWNTNQ